jgi:hypothetical protein
VQEAQNKQLEEKMEEHHKQQAEMREKWRGALAAKNEAHNVWEARQRELKDREDAKKLAEGELKRIQAASHHADFDAQLAAWEAQRDAALEALHATQQACAVGDRDWNAASVRACRRTLPVLPFLRRCTCGCSVRRVQMPLLLVLSARRTSTADVRTHAHAWRHLTSGGACRSG